MGFYIDPAFWSVLASPHQRVRIEVAGRREPGCWLRGREVRPARREVVPWSIRAPWLCGRVVQVFAAGGGPQTRVNSSAQELRHGQLVGRCDVIRRAEEPIRVGGAMSWWRIVALVDLASMTPVMVAAATRIEDLLVGGGEDAWNRQMSNNLSCPSVLAGSTSGIRRATNRPGTWLAFVCAAMVVNSMVYSIVVQASSPIATVG